MEGASCSAVKSLTFPIGTGSALQSTEEDEEEEWDLCMSCGECLDECETCECPEDAKCLKMCEQMNGGKCPYYPY